MQQEELQLIPGMLQQLLLQPQQALPTVSIVLNQMPAHQVLPLTPVTPSLPTATAALEATADLSLPLSHQQVQVILHPAIIQVALISTIRYRQLHMQT
jgi:hypothetical protein